MVEVYRAILTYAPSWLLAIFGLTTSVMLVALAVRTPVVALNRYEVLIIALGIMPLVLFRTILTFGTAGDADLLLLRNAALSRIASLQFLLAMLYVAGVSLRREYRENA